jgi:5-methylcytosine-specific restriction endonuclease McrA
MVLDTPMTEKSKIIASVCNALNGRLRDQAISLLKRDYPFAPDPVTERQYGPFESTRVFIRDGFTDRYTGDRLIFPPVLRLISVELPLEFPYHPNWKTDVTHPAFWEIGATVDHLVPVTRGGEDAESNWVTTSMARNSAKMNWTLTELGWNLHAPGDFKEWDGLIHWFLEYTNGRPELVATTSMRQWRRAAKVLALAADVQP